MQVVAAGGFDSHPPPFFGLAARFRNRNGPLSGQILSCQRFRTVEDLLWCTGGNHLAAMNTRSGSHINHIIGQPNGILVMFHNQHGVAEIAQPDQCCQQPVIVALVQANGWLVQNIQHTCQPRSNLRGKADTL